MGHELNQSQYWNKKEIKMKLIHPKQSLPTVADLPFIDSISPDFLQALFNPFQFGYGSGKEWVKRMTS